MRYPASYLNVKQIFFKTMDVTLLTQDRITKIYTTIDTFWLDGLFYVCNIMVPIHYSAAGVIYLLKVYVYNLLPPYEIHF